MREQKIDEDSTVIVNGVREGSDRYLVQPLSREGLGRIATELPLDTDLLELLKSWEEGKAVRDPFRAPSSIVEDPADLSQAGWGVIFAENTDPKIRRALAPLLELRSRQAKDLYFDLTYTKGSSLSQFIKEIGATLNVRPVPEKLPYYLMLVGDPESIPFKFQSYLDVQYAVGRLYFDGETIDQQCASYNAYAQAVADFEDGLRRPPIREVNLFAVENPGDEGTLRACGELAEPLAEILKRTPHWKATVIGPKEAYRESLRQLLGSRQRRAIFFAACHGVGYSCGDSRQEKGQGALVCQDWGGPGTTLLREHYFAAEDVPSEADLSGTMAVLISCHSAGTPEFDDFQQIQGKAERLTPRPLVARLPQKLLEKGALAVIGHVDRAWTSSFSSESEGSQVHAYYDLLNQLMKGEPVGWAMETMGGIFATTAASLHEMWLELKHFRQSDYAVYSDLWRETNDARNFVVLGDPAVRLNVD